MTETNTKNIEQPLHSSAFLLPLITRTMTIYKDYGYTSASSSPIYNYILQPLLKVLSAGKDRIILDIGCGNGWLCNHLLQLGYNAYGTDPSESGIAIAKKTNSNRFFVQNLSMNYLPAELSDIKFNTIISTEVIEHLYSPGAYLDFCRKILLNSGGGELIISTPYHGYLKNIVLAVTGKMDEHFTVLRDGGHIKFWSKNTLSKILEAKGFTGIKITGCGRMPLLWKSMLASSSIYN